MSTSRSLQDLASLLGTSPSEPTEKDSRKRGYDGQPIQLKIRKESRRGKTITVIAGFQSRPAELQSLLSRMKSKFGTGGTVLDNALELQGDQVAKCTELLKAEGYSIKK